MGAGNYWYCFGLGPNSLLSAYYHSYVFRCSGVNTEVTLASIERSSTSGASPANRERRRVTATVRTITGFHSKGNLIYTNYWVLLFSAPSF